MADWQTRRGSFQNPGDGNFRIFPDWASDGISCITIEERPIKSPLSGVLNFTLGIVGETVNLGLGERVLTLPGGGPVDYVDMVATGLNPDDDFSIKVH